MSEFLASNDWQWRLPRTIVQGVLGVVIANLDLILGWCVLDPGMRGLVLDLGPSWAKRWLDRVREKTGATPGIYTSKSVLFSYDWSSVAKTYPLWVAQYPNYEETGFLSEPWTDGWDFGAWESPLIFHYTGTGRIPGYGGHLDLDLFYGTKDDWRRLCAVAGASAGTGEVKEVAISRSSLWICCFQ